MDKIYNNPKIAICGLGRWGTNHLRVFSELIGKDNIMIYDPSHVVTSNIIASNKANTASSIEQAIEWADAVVVSSPAQTHYEVAERAIMSGRHVFIEKPMAATERQAQKLSDLGDKNAVIVAVDHILLHNPAVDAIRNQLVSGAIGDIVYVDIDRTHFGWRVVGEDVINSLMIHDIYLVENLFGNIIDIATCGAVGIRSARGRLDTKYDDVTVSLKTDQGVMVRAHASWTTARKQRYVSISGSTGSIEWNDLLSSGNGSIIISDKYINNDLELISSQTESKEIQFSWSEPLKNAAIDFINALTTGSDVKCNAKDGVRAVRMTDAIRRALG